MQFPYGELFRTPNSFYFFDANKNEFLAINQASFEFLCSLKETRPNSVVPNEIAELQQSGYLACESIVEYIGNPSTDYLEYFLDRKLSKMTLQLPQPIEQMRRTRNTTALAWRFYRNKVLQQR